MGMIGYNRVKGKKEKELRSIRIMGSKNVVRGRKEGKERKEKKRKEKKGRERNEVKLCVGNDRGKRRKGVDVGIEGVVCVKRGSR